MKKLSISLLIMAFLMLIQIVTEINYCKYTFEKNYLQSWQLAEKSSTIVAKQKYINDFYHSLETGYSAGKFSDNDAIFMCTANNSFKYNLETLKTLCDRLSEIQTMNPSSFEYNTAIQQITAQEQGEAGPMITVFDGCYTLKNYTLVWKWLLIIETILMFLSFGAGFVICTTW